ncbi:MAG: carboxypeptidase regulatory-like domain-containing protein, partial [Vicinamibacterales bacterium]
MSRCARWSLRAVLLLLLSPGVVWGQGVGAIGGTVLDASGAVLPGVSVTLSNPGTIGGSQETVTDDRGTYQFSRLVPGRYSVRGQLAGFRPFVLENIIVNADATARADLRLELGDVSESITVSGQAPLLDTTSALNQTVMDRQVLDTLPGTNDLWGIARVVPSVVMNKYDVGGSESFQQSKITVHGSSPDGESQYQIDGMNIDAAVGATGNVTMYYDPFMFEEINYQTSNGSAENARGGIVYNLITKTGSNAFRGAFMANGSNQHFQSNNITPELRRDLLAAVPARALAANPNITPGAKILHIFDVGGSVSGPVLRDRVWFTANSKAVGLDQLRLGSYNPDGSQFVDDNFMKTASVKGSWAINARNQLHATHIFNNKQRFHYNGNVTTGFVESQATWNQTLRTNLDQLKWTSTLSSRLVVDVSASAARTLQDLPPQSEVENGMIAGLDLLTQTTLVAQPTYSRSYYTRRVAHANVTYASGQHNIRAGYQYDLGRNDQYTYSISHFPSGLRAN